MKLTLSLAFCAALVAQDAQASRLWRWSYEGQGAAASGTFTTSDSPDADGFYEIVAITGEANGVAITGLQPAGTSIPGNDGYPVDNRVKAGAIALKEGFGFSMADGTYATPFYGAHFSPPSFSVVMRTYIEHMRRLATGCLRETRRARVTRQSGVPG